MDIGLDGIYDVLIGTTAVTDGLDTYDYGAGPEPAIFKGITPSPPGPDDTLGRYITITQTATAEGATSRSRKNRAGDIFLDVTVWANKNQNSRAVHSALAKEVWLALDRAVFTPSDARFDLVYCLAAPGQFVTDTEGFPGYLIETSIRFREIP